LGTFGLLYLQSNVQKMNFDTIIRAIGRATAAVIMFLFYAAGKKTARDEDDLEALKESNAQLTQQMIDGGKVWKKYDDLKSKIPDSWVDVGVVQSQAPKMPRKSSAPRA